MSTLVKNKFADTMEYAALMEAKLDDYTQRLDSLSVCSSVSAVNQSYAFDHGEAAKTADTRMFCLRTAAEQTGDMKEVLSRAKAYEEYINVK